MSYSSAHETSDLRAYAFEGGTLRARGRVAFLRCLRPSPLPDPSSQFSWRTLVPHSQEPRMRPTNRAQRHPRLRRARPRRPQCRLLAPQRGPLSLRRERDRGTTGDPAPESEELRQREYALDACYGRRGELRRRHNRKKDHGRDYPGDFVAPGGPLGAGEEMDREPRSGVREKKGDRDRLIRLAQSHPEWVLGFEDETWFSRFERPSLHSWEQAGQPKRLQKEARKDDSEPKALLLRA